MARKLFPSKKKKAAAMKRLVFLEGGTNLCASRGHMQRKCIKEREMKFIRYYIHKAREEPSSWSVNAFLCTQF